LLYSKEKKKKIGHVDISFEDIKNQMHSQDWYFLFRKKVIVPGAAIFMRWDYTHAPPVVEDSPPKKKSKKKKNKDEEGEYSSSYESASPSEYESKTSFGYESRGPNTPSISQYRGIPASYESRTPSSCSSRTHSSYPSRAPSMYSQNSPEYYERGSPREYLSYPQSPYYDRSDTESVSSSKSTRSRSSRKSSSSKSKLEGSLTKEQLKHLQQQKRDQENVEKIGEIVSSLKTIVVAQAREIELQKQVIKKISEKVENSDDSMYKTNKNYQKILRRW